jgi:hypothetical protein
MHSPQAEMRKKLIQECARVKQNSEYNAESHYTIAKDNKGLAFGLQVVPSLVTVGASSFLVVGQAVPAWWGWAVMIAALVTAYGNVKNPLKDYYDHWTAANSYTTLKNDARFLGEVLAEGMDDKMLAEATKALHNRYNCLTGNTPPIDDSAFMEARKKIHAGIHEPDK